MLRFFLAALVLLLTVPALAQDDSLQPVAPPVDTVRSAQKSPGIRPTGPRDTLKPEIVRPVVLPIPATIDSYSMRPVVTDSWKVDEHLPLGVQVMRHHPFFDFHSQASPDHNDVRKRRPGKEAMFYILLGLLFLFALLRQSFAKYFYDLFRVFFRTTMKQRQIREQLMQNPVPSFFFNVFFVASAGLYIDFMLHYFNLVPRAGSVNFWLLYLYCCVGLTVIYLGKFIGLKIAGWLFNMQKAADSYTFIVFIINKVIGIFLLPFLILLAFTAEPVYTICLVLSWSGLGAFLLYRFILGFAAIRNEVRFNLFHFFLYLCAFEITPLLLIYKLLLLVF